MKISKTNLMDMLYILFNLIVIGIGVIMLAINRIVLENFRNIQIEYWILIALGIMGIGYWKKERIGVR
jgi:hypothetical protein